MITLYLTDAEEDLLIKALHDHRAQQLKAFETVPHGFSLADFGLNEIEELLNRIEGGN